MAGALRAASGHDHAARDQVPAAGRSDLIARAHQEGEVLAVAHCEEGTQLTARVPPDLAAQLTGASPGLAVSANAARSPRPATGN